MSNLDISFKKLDPVYPHFHSHPTKPNQTVYAFPLSQECWYFVKEGQRYTRKDITGEDMKLKGCQNLDPAMREAMTDAESGLMRPGALPSIAGVSKEGSKALLDAIEQAGSELKHHECVPVSFSNLRLLVTFEPMIILMFCFAWDLLLS